MPVAPACTGIATSQNIAAAAAPNCATPGEATFSDALAQAGATAPEPAEPATISSNAMAADDARTTGRAAPSKHAETLTAPSPSREAAVKQTGKPATSPGIAPGAAARKQRDSAPLSPLASLLLGVATPEPEAASAKPAQEAASLGREAAKGTTAKASTAGQTSAKGSAVVASQDQSAPASAGKAQAATPPSSEASRDATTLALHETAAANLPAPGQPKPAPAPQPSAEITAASRAATSPAQLARAASDHAPATQAATEHAVSTPPASTRPAPLGDVAADESQAASVTPAAKPGPSGLPAAFGIAPATTLAPAQAAGAAPVPATGSLTGATAATPAALAAAITALHQSGQASTVLRLDPPGLGALAVHVALGENAQVNVLFVPSSAQTAQLLTTGMEGLRQAMAATGLTLGQAGIGGQGGSSQNGQPNPGNQPRPEALAAVTVPAQESETGVRAYA